MSRAEPRICWLLETAAPWRHAVSTLISDHADQPGRWVIGRLAVVADERGHGIGKTVLAEAERLIRKAGGHVAAVHSEDKNFAMYEHLGYRITSELFDNGTHGWLVKALN